MKVRFDRTRLGDEAIARFGAYPAMWDIPSAVNLLLG